MPSGGSPTGLPVRSGADIRLADAFGLPGCPLCRERARTEAAYLEAILAESVNDVAFRARLDEARGFCAFHSREVLDADRRRAGSLAATILLWATLKIRLGELEEAHVSGGRTRSKRLEAASRPPQCPACARMTAADAIAVESVMHLAEGVAWVEAVAAAPFCQEHLLALASQRPAAAAWPEIEERHLARLRTLRDDLAGYAHASAHDLRDSITEAQQASADAGAAYLGGDAGSRRPNGGGDAG